MWKGPFFATYGVVYHEYDYVTFVHLPNYLINPLVYTYIWYYTALEDAVGDVDNGMYPYPAQVEAGKEMLGYPIFVREIVCMDKTRP